MPVIGGAAHACNRHASEVEPRESENQGDRSQTHSQSAASVHSTWIPISKKMHQKRRGDDGKGGWVEGKGGERKARQDFHPLQQKEWNHGWRNGSTMRLTVLSTLPEGPSFVPSTPSGDSQFPVTPSSGFCRHSDIWRACVRMCAYTHKSKNGNKCLFKRRKYLGINLTQTSENLVLQKLQNSFGIKGSITGMETSHAHGLQLKMANTTTVPNQNYSDAIPVRIALGFFVELHLIFLKFM